MNTGDTYLMKQSLSNLNPTLLINATGNVLVILDFESWSSSHEVTFRLKSHHDGQQTDCDLIIFNFYVKALSWPTFY